MSRVFGAARQNGMIVEDLDTAVTRWVERIGAGPFFVVRHLPLEYFSYRGVPSEPDISFALGFVGDLEIELIQQHNDADSPYRDFAKANVAGLHHVSAWTRTYDDDLDRLRATGFSPDCEGRVAGATRFAYFDAGAVDGTAFELSDLGADNEYGFLHDMIRDAGIDWDGTDPVRELSV